MLTGNQKYRYGMIPTIILFLLCPVLAIPQILLGIYNRKASAFIMFSILLGLFAFLTAPFADLYRHTMHYFSMEGLTWEQANFDFTTDWFSDFVNWVLINHGINYEWWRLIEIVESFILLVEIFRFKLSKSAIEYNNVEVFFRFILLFLLFELSHTISGVRFGFGMIQFVFGLHLLFERKKIFLALLFLYFSTTIHISFVFFVPIFFLLSFATRNKSGIILLLIVLFLSTSFLISQYSYLLGIRSIWYFKGGESIIGTGYEDITTIGKIVVLAPTFLLFPYIYFIIKYYDKESIWCRISIVWIIFLVLFVSNSVMEYRMRWGLQTIILFAVLDIERKILLSRKMKRILLVCALGITCINGLNYGHTFYKMSRYEYLITPAPYLLTKHYDYHWITSHIDNNEQLKEREDLFSD